VIILIFAVLELWLL